MQDAASGLGWGAAPRREVPGPKIFTDAEIRTVLTGIRMSRKNSIMERWVESCRSPASGSTSAFGARTSRGPGPVHPAPYPPTRPARRLPQECQYAA